MYFLKIVIVVISVVASIASEDVPNNSTVSENIDTGSNTTDLFTTKEDFTTYSNIDIFDDNSSEPTKLHHSTEASISTTDKVTIDTSHDIIITGTATIEDDGADETDPDSTTVYDDSDSTTNVVTTETIEVKSACIPNPCRNGGTCIEDDDVPSLFSCVCVTGYIGIRCGTVDKCVMDDDGQVCTNGACVYSADGLTRSCKCFPHTYWDDDKKECREPDPPCFPNPCLNGGTCSYHDDEVYCDCPIGYTTKNCSILDTCGDCRKGKCILDVKRMIKYCQCDEGLYWNKEDEQCEEMESPCDSNPCLNDGDCEAVSEEDYNCTCKTGFSGQACEIADKCSIDEDCEHGMCVMSSDNKERICHCHNGFYFEEMSHTCKEITNICEPNPCLNDGICTVISRITHNCTCSYGYSGPNCEIRDMCEMDGGNAYCGNGICSNNNELGVYYCTCEGDKYFQYSERKCAELDMCPLMHCDSMEKCEMGKCSCKDNFRWNNVTQKCEPDFCSSNPCPLSEMICEEGTGSTDYKCICQDGYSFNGSHCNEARCIFPTLNPCDQHCIVEDEGYKCSCTEDFDMKEDNHTCLYTGNSTCTNKTCGKGVCIQKEDNEECVCPLGFTETNGTCIDVCTAGQLESGVCPSDTCEVTAEGEFRCVCEGKLTLSKDKTTCMVRNVCKEKEIGWKTCMEKNAECTVDWMASKGFTCQCSNGQVPTDGEVCRDICSIESNQRTCSIKGATCDLDVKGKMICRCPPYFKPNERDGKCTQPADYSYLLTLPLDKSTYLKGSQKQRSLDTVVDLRKVSRDVTITMREMFLDFSQANVISCRMVSDFILCKIELQFVSEQKEALKLLETGDICLTNSKSDQCLLPPSLILVKNKINSEVKVEPTNPCNDDDIKNLICGSETTCISNTDDKSFNCSCKPGYFARSKSYPFGNTRSFIEMCSDINECEESNPCPLNSICNNTMGSYECHCKPGFRNMKDASLEDLRCVEICNPNPCMHGKCLKRDKHEFDCRCEAGYSGTLCNLQDENFKRAKINTIIVGVVLGGALLVTIILFVACVSRLRKKKSLENPGHLYYNTEMVTQI